MTGPALIVGLTSSQSRTASQVVGSLAEAGVEHLQRRLRGLRVLVAFALAADAVIAEDGDRPAGPAEIFDEGQGQAEQRFLGLAERGRDDNDGDGCRPKG